MAEINPETVAYIREQADKLERTLQQKIKSYGIKGIELLSSVSVSVKEAANGRFIVSVSFKTTGRFVDMGSGPGYSFGKPTGQKAYNSALQRHKTRRPKKFYTRPMYGWLYNLMEVVSFRNLSEANTLIKFEIEK